MKNMETLPHHAGTHYNLGNVLQATGRYEEAQSEWAQAVNAKPGRRLGSQIAYNQALQSIQRGDYDKARTVLVKSLKLWASDIDAKKNLEMTLLELKRNQQQKNKQQDSPKKQSQGVNKQNEATGSTRGGQGQFSKEQSEQILNSMMNNNILRPDQKQKRDDDEQDW
jgi:tetratricopeptide (TPR) repeat protein